MPEATTLGGPRRAVTFHYDGSVEDGVTIEYVYANVTVDQAFFRRILDTFRGRRLAEGFSMDNPTPNGFGENLTPRHASRIAAILVSEGYTTSDLENGFLFYFRLTVPYAVIGKLGMVPYAVIYTKYLRELYLHFCMLLAGLFQHEAW